MFSMFQQSADYTGREDKDARTNLEARDLSGNIILNY